MFEFKLKMDLSLSHHPQMIHYGPISALLTKTPVQTSASRSRGAPLMGSFK